MTFSKIKSWTLFLARPDILFYTLPWLMVLLIAGTLAQKEIGLYQAHQLYFSSWLIWLGPLPLPGAYPTLGLITVSLAAKFFLKSPWTKSRAGTWLTHLALLVLLAGGLLTSLTQKEGFIALEEGETTQLVSDYHERVTQLIKNDKVEKSVPFREIQKDGQLAIDSLKAEIIQRCENCLPAFVDPSPERKGRAAKVRLTSIKPETQNEQNFSGLTLKINGTGKETDGIYVLMEEMSPRLTFKGDDNIYEITIGRATRPLPFAVELLDFKMTMHPATQMAQAYRSDVVIHDGSLNYPVRIEMNEPLRYKGYTLYQSSFSELPGGRQQSILSVVENKGRLFPYLASALLAAGLLLHLIVRTRAPLILLFAVLTLFPFAPAQAEEPHFDMNAFKTLPVLHQGRLKPLDSFARANLITLKGSARYDGKPAIDWLAATLFDPAEAIHDPVFRIFNAKHFGLPEKKHPYYSYAELAPALKQQIPLIEKIFETKEKDWNADQKELIALHKASILYTQLLRSFAAYLPLSVNLPESLQKEWEIKENTPQTLSDFKRYEGRLKKRLKSILVKKGENPANYTKEEQEIAAFAFSMSLIEQAGAQNLLLRILPGTEDEENGRQWYSPWALGQEGQGSPVSAAYLKNWQDMIKAYRAGDTKAWLTQTEKAKILIKNSGINTHPQNLKLEIIYNTLHPLGLAMIFFGAAFLLTLASRSAVNAKYKRSLYLASFGALSAALLFNVAAVVLRIVILDRPPVGTLYESVIFVSAICGIGSLFLEIYRKDGLGILISALGGVLLLFVAGSLAGPDTMQVLTAVLNTNFWLTIHVLCITMGYGWCAIAALLAHYYLFARWRAVMEPTKLSNLAMHIKTFALISLLFTAVGTILGGIWADQSWGRFWGWDPKENGALLIVLWISWALHGLLSRHLKPLGFITAIAGLNIVVALAWFGVNLLSTGLHSYGFIEGVATGLGLFCAFEILVIGTLHLAVRKQERLHHAA